MLIQPGRLLNSGLHYNAAKKLLNQIGYGYLAANLALMVSPNDPSRDDTNRHHVFTPAGWQNLGVLSRGDPKNDLIGGVLRTIPAGQLGPNGRIEAAFTSLIDSNFTHWGRWQSTVTEEIDPVFQKRYKGTLTLDGNAAISSPQVLASGTKPIWRFAVKAGSGVNAAVDEFGFYVGGAFVASTATIISGSGSLSVAANVHKITGLDSSWTVIQVVPDANFAGVAVAYWYPTGRTNPTAGDYSYIAWSSFQESYISTWIDGPDTTVRAADSFYVDADFSAIKAFLYIGNPPFGSDRSGYSVSLSYNGVYNDPAGGSAYLGAGTGYGANCYRGAASGGDIVPDSGLANVTFAQALTWNDSSFSTVCNGSSKLTQGQGGPLNLDHLEVGTLENSYDTNRKGIATYLIMLFNRELTEAEMQSLTSAAMINAVSGGL